MQAKPKCESLQFCGVQHRVVFSDISVLHEGIVLATVLFMETRHRLCGKRRLLWPPRAFVAGSALVWAFAAPMAMGQAADAAAPPPSAEEGDSDAVAIAELEAWIERTPEAADPWRELGWAHWRQGRFDEARRVWESWRRIDPRRAEVHALLGRLHLRDDRHEEAITSLRLSLALDPDQEDMRFALAQALRWRGHLDESIEMLRELLNKRQEDRHVRLELARALSSNWEYDQALPLWSDLRAEDPDDRDVQRGETLALLHAGFPSLAIRQARRLLRDDPDDWTALTVLADEADFGDRPADALPWVKRLIAIEADGRERMALRNRMQVLLRRIGEVNPASADPDLEMELVRENLEANPHNVDQRVLLAELLTRQGRLDAAESMLVGILREFNARNVRAHMALFEIALQRRNGVMAGRHLEILRQFHPSDPYLFWHEARLQAAVGNMAAADAALDRLAAAGERGAVAVLLHHALTPSRYGPTLSVSRFREHLRALMDAGYLFVTPEQIHDRWESDGPAAGRTADGRIRRVVAITFDDGLVSAMRYGTEAGVDYGLRFAQYLVVGFMERGDPYLADWEGLARYAASGVWEYGSHLHYAHDRAYIDDGTTAAQPAAARLWLTQERRRESESEFAARLRHEYDYAAAQIREHLGQPCRGVAYPYGNIGQEGVSNMPEATVINLRHAARNHEIGFIQTPFAHAVRGANPLLYSRHEMDIHWSGEQVVQYLIDRHPFMLAERTRFEFAQWQGRATVARRSLERLRVAGYPAAALQAMENGLSAAMAPVFAVPETARTAGVELYGRHDNYKARQTRAFAQGGLSWQSGIHLQARLGGGRLAQHGDDADAMSLTETFSQLEMAYVDAQRRVLTAGIGWRDWQGDARGSQFEGWAEAHGRWIPELAWRARAAFEAIDQARARARHLERTVFQGEMHWETGDDWSLGVEGVWNRLSDGNRIVQGSVQPIYRPLGWHGVHVGARFMFMRSDTDTEDIWTPRRLEAYYALVGWRGWRYGGRVDARLQAGVAQETPFAEPPDDEAEVGPTEKTWRNAYGASIAWQRDLNRHWIGGFQAGWNHSPTYRELQGRVQGVRRF